MTRLLAALALAAAPVEASACRLALALAVDISKSVDSAEFRLQFDGLAAAFRDPEVRDAILSGPDPVAAAVFVWSGKTRQALAADWRLLTDAAAIDRLAATLAAAERTSAADWTSIGAALIYAHGLLARGPDCRRRVVDVSGDGYQNDGPSPRQAYASRDWAGVTVNALVITGLTRPRLTDYFRREVARGPGAFVEATVDFSDYAEAIRRKLLKELKPPAIVANVTGEE